MTRLTVVTRDGAEQTLDVKPGRSVMMTIRDHGIDELLAICGGCLSCATCHVYVDPAMADRLPPVRDDEDMLLDAVEGRTGQSRLSCQIPMTDALDGLRVTIAPED